MRTVKQSIKEIVEKISGKVGPAKIVLFGSYANGNYDKNSDLDLMIVTSGNNKSKYRVIDEIEAMLHGSEIPTDIVVYSQKEIDSWENVKMAFPTIIMKTGKVLYEKQ